MFSFFIKWESNDIIKDEICFMGNESIKNIFKGNVGKLLFIKYYKLKNLIFQNRLWGMMPAKSKRRTPEQKARKKLKEEKFIIDLELGVKKEKFKKTTKIKPRLDFSEKR